MRRFGIGYERLHYLLSCKSAARETTRRLRVEDQRTQAVVAHALATFDEGGTVRDVAATLGCSNQTAWKFLKRQGRSPARRASCSVAAGESRPLVEEPRGRSA